MAHPKVVFASILLVLSLFHCVHSSEGRKLKPLRKNEFPKLTARVVIFKKETKEEVVGKNINLHGERTDRTSNVNEHAPRAQLPPMSATPQNQTGNETQVTPPGHVDDFRPTTPGHSPGVGHSLQN
ncbi:hypothetical protein Vadar_027566 [Vaccinium darrowii]|uniref:Uncharacterized protein n=1 Tax=Vaccinium darrowii TaxID=229202 RepID=A0ACB7Y3F9_9ERIC|nr:hypothetical protein Vadar_027566 [Vaccinium darrowii]